MSIVELPPAPNLSYGTAQARHASAERSARSYYHRYFKRWQDAALVVASAPVTVPLIAVCAALVALDGHSPLFRQRRVGRDGAIFRIIKRRSRVPDAEAALAHHIASNAKARAESDSFQKLQHDPRVAPIGDILRKTLLDELPQLWNVLFGDMAGVGPRPMTKCQKTLIPAPPTFCCGPASPACGRFR